MSVVMPWQCVGYTEEGGGLGLAGGGNQLGSKTHILKTLDRALGLVATKVPCWESCLGVEDPCIYQQGVLCGPR